MGWVKQSINNLFIYKFDEKIELINENAIKIYDGYKISAKRFNYTFKENEELIIDYLGYSNLDGLIELRKNYYGKIIIDQIYCSSTYPNIIDSKDNENGFGLFSSTIFNSGANFMSANFIRQTCFINSIFYGYASFNASIFKEKVRFINTKFMNDTNFYIAKFEKNIKFEKVVFLGNVDFRGTEFKDALYFQNISFGNLFFINDILVESFIVSNINFIDSNGIEITKENKIIKRYKKLLKNAKKEDQKSFHATCELLLDKDKHNSYLKALTEYTYHVVSGKFYWVTKVKRYLPIVNTVAFIVITFITGWASFVTIKSYYENKKHRYQIEVDKMYVNPKDERIVNIF